MLRKAVSNHLGDHIRASFGLPLTNENMSFISWLFSRADVHRVEYADDGVGVVFEAIPWFADKVKGRVKQSGVDQHAV